MSIKIKDLLRCYAMGMGIKSISNAFCISRNTVRKYARLFQKSGLTMERLQKMPEHHLQELFCRMKSATSQTTSFWTMVKSSIMAIKTMKIN